MPKSVLLSLRSSLGRGKRPQPRPGFGTRRTETMLWTNHQHLLFHGDLPLCRYSIEIGSDGGGQQPTGKKVKRVVQLLLEEYLSQYGNNIATEFKLNLAIFFSSLLPIWMGHDLVHCYPSCWVWIYHSRYHVLHRRAQVLSPMLEAHLRTLLSGELGRT